MEIRYLTADDAAEYSKLRLEMLQREPQAFSSSAEEHGLLSIDELRRRIGSLEQDQFIVGAWEGSQLFGAIGFYREKGPKTRHKGRIWGVYVAPEKRGRGFARKMLETVLQRASTIGGVEQVTLSVTAGQTSAIHLYESVGFKRWGCEPQALRVGADYIDEYHMVLLMK